MTTNQRLGEILVEEKLVSRETIEDALRAQVNGNRRLGSILLKMHAITSDELTTALSKELNIPICNIPERATKKARKMIPRYLCKQYCVLPLEIKKGNILEVAMSDLEDFSITRDLENYTGMLVTPILSFESEIQKEISKRIPVSLKDIFSPLVIRKIRSVVLAICLISVVGLTVTLYNYIQAERYGTISHLANRTLYENLDLLIGFDRSGKISLLGRGAFAEGYYSVTFNDIITLKAFVAGMSNDFSQKQSEWLHWVITEENVAEGHNSGLANK